MAAPTFTILRIPADSPRILEIADKLRETRLAALKAEPNGFAVKYEDEILHPAGEWLRRLTSPLDTIFVCVASPEPPSPTDDTVETLLKGDWVGMVTLRGPLPYSSYYNESSRQPVPKEPELQTFWHMCALYTSKEYRGRGLAKRLINATLAFAREHTRSIQGEKSMKARIRLFADPAKTLVVGLYKGLGFTEAGDCSLEEAFIANGDKVLVPADVESTEQLRNRWRRRFGLSMERVVDA